MEIYNIIPMKKLIVLALCVAMFSSCATIFSGSKKKVTFDGEPKVPLTLVVDGYRYPNVTFPCVVKVPRGFNTSLVNVEVEGYEPQMIMVDKRFNAAAILNFASVFGWVIDAVSGAMMTTEYEYYWVKLEPIAE